MSYVRAFLAGGLICALVQILLDRTKWMPGRIMVFLVCLGGFLGFLHIYPFLLDFGGAGVGILLPGFGSLLWEGVRKAVDQNGILGIFAGGLTAGAAGISAALVFGYIAALIFEPKMKG